MLTRRNFVQAAPLGAMLAEASCKKHAGSGRPGIIGAKNIAEAGFIYGLPIVMNYAIMYQFVIDKASPQFKAPLNQIKNEHQVFTYKDTAVPTPNSDTPYSLGWLDLRAEPVVISVPAVDPKRYYSVQLCDGNTYNFGYIGSRATGNAAGSYLVAGPDWKGEKPAGIEQVFTSSTQFTAAIFRTQLYNADDMENVEAVQAGYKVRPLSALLNQPAPPPAAAIDFPAIDAESAKKNFFKYLDFALQFAPPQPNEVAIRAQLARIGIGAGKPFDFDGLSLLDKGEILLGLKQGSDKVDDAVAKAGFEVNGWRVSGVPGTSAAYNGDWLYRAVVAKAGIYGNTTQEACYPFTRSDSDGQVLDGSKHIYTLTFPAGQLPPVNAFWSMTMYDSAKQLLVENPINRYLINSPMLGAMKKNDDGSLTIYIQHTSPGADRQANWLPAPSGPIYLVMRLYWPKTAAPSLLPIGQGTWNPPGIKRI